MAQALREAGEVWLSVVVLGELRAGFRKGGTLQKNERLLREFLSSPRVTVLGVDEETSERYAIIHDDLRRRGKPVSVNHVWIAASAFQQGLRVLTTDSDFLKITQIVVDYFEPAGG